MWLLHLPTQSLSSYKHVCSGGLLIYLKGHLSRDFQLLNLLERVLIVK